MKDLASWKTLTGTRPTIESERTIATVTFSLKSAIQRLNISDVPVKLTDTKVALGLRRGFATSAPSQ